MKSSAVLWGIAAAALLQSCQPSVKQTDQALLTFDTLTIDTVCALMTDSLSPTYHFQLSMEYPVSSSKPELLHTVESFIVNLYFKDNYVGMSPVEAAYSYCEHNLDRYRSDSASVTELYGEDREAAMRWMSYEESSAGRALFVSDRFMSYAVEFAGYSGGAHGNYVVHNSVIDLETACPLFLSDIFADGAQDEVADMLRRQLASDQDCATVEELMDRGFFSPQEVELNENFYIDGSGITWQYNPYDIACYACGLVSVTLTWNQLYPFLLEESPLISMAEAADSTARTTTTVAAE